jgi:excisionase family DNA binding protein
VSARAARKRSGEPPPFQSFIGKPRYSVAEASELLGISRALAWQRIKAGKLAVVRDGKRSFVTNEEVARYARESHES